MRKRIVAGMAAPFWGWAVFVPSFVSAQSGEPQVQLPEGEPRAFIEGACVACHRLDYIPNSRGYSHEDWSELISSMILLPEDLAASVTTYLADHFPKKPGTDPVLIDGPVNVTITEWLAPTLGSRPHDPADDGCSCKKRLPDQTWYLYTVHQKYTWRPAFMYSTSRRSE